MKMQNVQWKRLQNESFDKNNQAICQGVALSVLTYFATKMFMLVKGGVRSTAESPKVDELPKTRAREAEIWKIFQISQLLT